MCTGKNGKLERSRGAGASGLQTLRAAHQTLNMNGEGQPHFGVAHKKDLSRGALGWIKVTVCTHVFYV